MERISGYFAVQFMEESSERPMNFRSGANTTRSFSAQLLPRDNDSTRSFSLPLALFVIQSEICILTETCFAKQCCCYNKYYLVRETSGGWSNDPFCTTLVTQIPAQTMINVVRLAISFEKQKKEFRKKERVIIEL